MNLSKSLTNVLLRLVGVSPPTVAGEEFAEVRIRYVALAIVTIMVSLLAGNSMGFAVYTLTGSAKAYAAVATVWFLVILTVESFLIVSLKPTFTVASFFAIGMRLSMAVLISQLASVPLEQYVFRPEIANEISISSGKDLTADKLAFEKEYEPALEALGNQEGTLQGQLTTLALACEKKHDAYIDEWKGVKGDSFTGVPGRGRWTELNELQYKRCKDELDRQTNEDLKDSLAAQLKSVNVQIKKVEDERDGRLTERRLAIEANNGIIARIKALHRLTEQNSEVKFKVWLLRLFIIVLETMPLTGKLFMVFSRFEQIRAEREHTSIEYERKSTRAVAEEKRQVLVTRLADHLREQEFRRGFSLASYAQARQSGAFEGAVLRHADEIVGGLNGGRKPEVVGVKAAAGPSSNGRGNGKQ